MVYKLITAYSDAQLRINGYRHTKWTSYELMDIVIRNGLDNPSLNPEQDC